MGWLARLWRWLAGSHDAAISDTAAGERRVTRPADWDDVVHLAALLERHRVEYVLIGGYALYANGLIRNTGDQPGRIRVFDVFVVDVMPRACGLSFGDIQPFIARLERGGRGINVLDLEGLLRTKQGVREKDIADRQQIELALARRPCAHSAALMPSCPAVLTRTRCGRCTITGLR
jgi:hypothetical protein